MGFLSFIFSIKFLLVLWVICIVILYSRLDKEYKLSYKDKYFKKLPDNYTPAEMKILVNYKKLYPQDIVATLIDLIVKDAVKVKKIKNDENILTSKQNDYILSKNNSFDFEKLLSHEITLINWLINTIGNSENVSLKQVKDFTRKSNTAIEFSKGYKDWCKSVIISSEKNNFFKSKNIATLYGMTLGIIYFIITIVLFICFQRYAYLFLVIPSAITCIYTLNILKRTQYGQEQYELWMAFKRFIKDFGKDGVYSSLEECEEFISYSVSLGVSQNLISYVISNYDENSFNNENLKIFNKIPPNEFETLLNFTSKTFETSVIASNKAKELSKSKRQFNKS